MERIFDYEYWGFDTLPIKYNMAMEEYLLSRSEAKKTSTIRFWNVDKDSVVLGYAEAENAIKKTDETFDIARRITGGSHVQFDENSLAYSFTIPRDEKFLHFDEMRAYFAARIEDALVELGIDTVKSDNLASTININNKVVASHAIFWGVKSALMHGLVAIDPYDVDKIADRVLLSARKIGKKTYTEYDALKAIPALSKIVRGHDDYAVAKLRREHVKRLLAKTIVEKVTGGTYNKVSLKPVHINRAYAMLRERHYGEGWTKDRTPPYTLKEVEEIPGEELAGRLRENLGYCIYSQVSDKDFAGMTE